MKLDQENTLDILDISDVSDIPDIPGNPFSSAFEAIEINVHFSRFIEWTEEMKEDPRVIRKYHHRMRPDTIIEVSGDAISQWYKMGHRLFTGRGLTNFLVKYRKLGIIVTDKNLINVLEAYARGFDEVLQILPDNISEKMFGEYLLPIECLSKIDRAYHPRRNNYVHLLRGQRNTPEALKKFLCGIIKIKPRPGTNDLINLIDFKKIYRENSSNKCYSILVTKWDSLKDLENLLEFFLQKGLRMDITFRGFTTTKKESQLLVEKYYNIISYTTGNCTLYDIHYAYKYKLSLLGDEDEIYKLLKTKDPIINKIPQQVLKKFMIDSHYSVPIHQTIWSIMTEESKLCMATINYYNAIVMTKIFLWKVDDDRIRDSWKINYQVMYNYVKVHEKENLDIYFPVNLLLGSLVRQRTNMNLQRLSGIMTDIVLQFVPPEI